MEVCVSVSIRRCLLVSMSYKRPVNELVICAGNILASLWAMTIHNADVTMWGCHLAEAFV